MPTATNVYPINGRYLNSDPFSNILDEDCPPWNNRISLVY
jgi:hypothetical protein